MSVGLGVEAVLTAGVHRRFQRRLEVEQKLLDVRFLVLIDDPGKVDGDELGDGRQVVFDPEDVVTEFGKLNYDLGGLFLFPDLALELEDQVAVWFQGSDEVSNCLSFGGREVEVERPLESGGEIDRFDDALPRAVFQEFLVEVERQVDEEINLQLFEFRYELPAARFRFDFEMLYVAGVRMP